MCGFLGVLLPPGQSAQAGLDRWRAAAAKLRHRGNSSHGEWLEANCALLHHRLAFRDLSAGTQPMPSNAGEAALVFNGELYDYQQLRARIPYDFRTTSDTEVILAHTLAKGTAAVDDFDGEYAFGLWFSGEQRLILARDIFGVKPLFLYNAGFKGAAGRKLREFSAAYEFELEGEFFFASEIKGLPVKLAWEERGLRRQLLGLYEESGTPFEGVVALPPGSVLEAKWQGERWVVRVERRAQPMRKRSRGYGEVKDYPAAASKLREILRENVRAKLDADVPLGIYLSGGIDSRVAAFEMGRLGAKVQSFTVGFADADYDESRDVQTFLARSPNIRGLLLRTDNSALAYAYEHAIYASEMVQPYTNGCAKWWLSRFARRHVRGVLTGDGSDELLCGYPSYRALAWWQFYRRQPSAARRQLLAARFAPGAEKPWEKGWSSQLDGSDLEESERVFGWIHPLGGQILAQGEMLLGAEARDAWLASERETLLGFSSPESGLSPLARWQNYFLRTHFPTHVLNWVGDRMEMANTLEGRPIFLSRALGELIGELPDASLVRGLRDKALLRAAYKDALGELAFTPKKQFNAPFLMPNGLREKFLSPASLKTVGLVDTKDLANIEAAGKAGNPLLSSYASMLLQNILVVHMLQRYLIEGEAPERDLDFEEKFLDTRTITLQE